MGAREERTYNFFFLLKKYIFKLSVRVVCKMFLQENLGDDQQISSFQPTEINVHALHTSMLTLNMKHMWLKKITADSRSLYYNKPSISGR